ncbi:MAG: hypothetical protein JWL87_672 [Candidatus Adlerbacteria bacterium]|nr:hypothetical protein [Candidatus Adlerbacteria bacterium]
MPVYQLAYAQPRSANYSPKVPIWERRFHKFDAQDDFMAQGAANQFLDSTPVACGGRMYKPSQYRLSRVEGLQSVPL